MIKARWNGAVLAASEQTEVVEGNHYFARSAMNPEYFSPSETRSHCPWKGEAHYYHVTVGKQINEDAAWYYPDPKPSADNIRDRVAFWRGVEVSAE